MNININDISIYSDKMHISQVLVFFERYGINFTRSQIQNYLKFGILPPLISKRYYSKDHLVLLALLHTLKDTCTLQEIKNIFSLVLSIEDISLQNMYTEYVSLQENMKQNLIHVLSQSLDEIKITGKNSKNISDLEKTQVINFMSILLIASLAKVAKQYL